MILWLEAPIEGEETLNVGLSTTKKEAVGDFKLFLLHEVDRRKPQNIPQISTVFIIINIKTQR